MRLGCLIALSVVLAGDATAVDGPLQDLARFVRSYYLSDRHLVNREISFTSSLAGEPPTLLDFSWKVTARDQYGTNKGDELFGVAKYGATGLLDQLVVGGPNVEDKHLRRLRSAIRASRRWPKSSNAAFGPNASPGEIGRATATAVGGLLGISLRVETVEFRLMRPSGEPDATWHIVLRAAERTGIIGVRARVEPFAGKIIQLDVCRDGEHSMALGTTEWGHDPEGSDIEEARRLAAVIYDRSRCDPNLPARMP